MKICPKCRGYHFDDEEMCADCKIKLMDKQDFTKIICALDKMTPEERRKVAHSAPYDIICKYHFSNEYGHDEKQSKSEIAEMRQRAKLRKIEKEQKEMEQNIPHCPTCGSTNVKRITTLNRAISIGILGILSGKIGKNYECLNCKARW